MDWWGFGWWSAFVERVRQLIRPAEMQTIDGAGWGWSGDGGGETYAQLYKTQTHVRTVVDFLAIQLGQLGIHVYRRLSDTDRVRVNDHPLARLLRAPNPGTTRALFISELIQDYEVYGYAAAVKVRRPNRLELYRVPALQIRAYGDLIPRAFTWTLPNGQRLLLDAADVFYLRQYCPDDPIRGLSPLETLRQMLSEETAARAFRTRFWQNGAKLSGWIGRPKDAPKWTRQQREEFREDWAQFIGPQNAGKSPVLEDGMEFNPVTATARDSELVPARKLAREEVAAAYHVQPAMIGILEAQGYGSLREQHKAMYQDTLGPLNAMLELEIDRQLLPEFSDTEGIYTQINIAEKLQGSFEEETASLASAVGSPYMTRNEARARLNLPRINDADFDKPVTRLDIAEGQNAMAPPVEAYARPALDAPDLERLGERLERTLRGLPREIADRLPKPDPVAITTRPVRDPHGRVVALEDCRADGHVIARRAVLRDALGHLVEVARVPTESA